MKDPFRNIAKVIRQKRAATIGKKLSKKRGNLTGVCAGLGAYLEVDPILVRAGFIGFTIFFPIAGILSYLGLSVFLAKDEAEKWGTHRYTFEEHERIIEESQVVRKNEPSPVQALAVCSNCDTVAKPNSKFCHKCGTML